MVAAISQGVDLREYSQSIESDLRQVEIDSINDYLKEANNLSSLYKEIRECDAILEVCSWWRLLLLPLRLFVGLFVCLYCQGFLERLR